MRINTLSILVSSSTTSLLFTIALRVVSGPLRWDNILAALILLLPLIVIIFTIFYLLSNYLLTKYRDSHHIKMILTRKASTKKEDGKVFRIPFGYLFLCLLLIFLLLFLNYIHPSFYLSIVTIILVLFYMKTPYRVDFGEDHLIIHLIKGKREILLSDIHSIGKGVFSNRIDYREGQFYLHHFITDLGRLMKLITDNTYPELVPEVVDSEDTRTKDAPAVLTYRAILLWSFTVLLSILGVLYFVNQVRGY